MGGLLPGLWLPGSAQLPSPLLLSTLWVLLGDCNHRGLSLYLGWSNGPVGSRLTFLPLAGTLHFHFALGPEKYVVSLGLQFSKVRT